MKTVCMLNGHLILREHKTGVHYFHEYITKELCLKKDKFDVKVAFFDKNRNHERLLSLENNRWIQPYCVIEKKWPRIFSYVLPIELFFGKNDIYFCDGLFPITIDKRQKRVCLVHDLMVKIFPENYSVIKKIYLELFFRTLPKADLIICVSENTKKDVMQYYGIPEEKIVVCYNGVTPLQGKKSYRLDNAEIDIQKRYLFYVGDMRPNKNLINTVKGFLDFCEKSNTRDLYFYIAGKQNGDYDRLQEILEKSKYGKQVVFLGYITDNDKFILYENTTAVVLLSLYEGFGMPIIEGMQHYKPVVTSNCSSMKEIGEGAAILVNPKDIKQISQAFETVSAGNYVVDKKIYDEKIYRYTFTNVGNIIADALEKLS